MIYFLINNNYHWYDVKLHLSTLKEAGYEIGLIQIPHTLNIIKAHNSISKIQIFQSPFIGRINFWNPFKVFNTHAQIESSLKLTKDDVLLAYTEDEFLNQYIIFKFKEMGAKVFLIDEGWQSILTYSNICYSGYPLKWAVKLFYLKYIIGYNYLQLNFLNNYIYPQINDKFIDGALCFRSFKMARKIPQTILERDTKMLDNLLNDRAIFLSQPLYELYVSLEEYTHIVYTVIKALSSQFNTVYFKFHPREKNTSALQSTIMSNYKNVEFIEEESGIEEIISIYKPKYAVSFQSVALLNLKDMGLIPVYCYKDFQNLSKCSDFKIIDEALSAMRYTFPANIDTILDSSCGFNTEQTSQSISLTQYLSRELHETNK